jgi:hypothetical protein
MNLVVSQFHIEHRLTAPGRKMIAVILSKTIGLSSYMLPVATDRALGVFLFKREHALPAPILLARNRRPKCSAARQM